MQKTSSGSIARRIKELRLMHGKTLEQIGEVVGVKKSTIQKYESGVIKTLPYANFVALANALEVTPEYLFSGVGKEEKTEAAQIPAEASIHVSLNEKSERETLNAVNELISAIEKANSLADELAQKIGRMKLGFKVSRV